MAHKAGPRTAFGSEALGHETSRPLGGRLVVETTIGCQCRTQARRRLLVMPAAKPSKARPPGAGTVPMLKLSSPL